MKSTIEWLKEYLETKVLPCPEGNDYVYGMNVAHNNLIHYMIPYLLEKEKEDKIAFADKYADDVMGGCLLRAREYYEQSYEVSPQDPAI